MILVAVPTGKPTEHGFRPRGRGEVDGEREGEERELRDVWGGMVDNELVEEGWVSTRESVFVWVGPTMGVRNEW